VSDVSERDLIDALVEEFLERQRQGEQPSLEEYLGRHPHLAGPIRARFATLTPAEPGSSEAEPTGEPPLAAALPPQGIPERLGDYRILRQVGRGGMGVVYEAVQESLGRLVALKVLSGPALLDPQLAARFHREAPAVARLHHTNIVQVYGVGEHNGLHYYVMQFIKGRGLDQALAELRAHRGIPRAPGAAAHALLNGRIPSDSSELEPTKPLGTEYLRDAPTELYRPSNASGNVPKPGRSESPTTSEFGRQYWRGVARIGLQVAEALAHAHAQGILHRDIKPSNLLLDDQGTVWVTDFGLAKEADEQDCLTRTGDVVGTLRYLAPERFQGRSDARGDIYSLGLTLYELLTLTPAFPSWDRSQLLHQVMHDDPLRPRQLDAAVPRDLETVVLKAIARDPALRYPTASALAEDLARFLDDRPVRARRTRPPERLWRWCRRNPTLATLTGAVFVLAVTVAVGSTLVAFRMAAARDDLARARDNEESQRRRAEAHARDSHQGLVQLQITKGLQLMDGGDSLGALAWFTHALELDGGQPAEEMHRVRLTAVLRQCPRLAQMWFHKGPTYSVEFSPDGRRVLTAGDDGVAQVWDLASGAASIPPLRHQEMVCYATFSPDGRRIVSASRDHSARVWDAATGEPVTGPLQHSGTVWTAFFSHDSRLVVTASADGTARVWSAASGQPLTPPLQHELNVAQAAFSPDGHWVATVSEDKTAKLWDASTGRQAAPPLRHEDGVDWAAFSPDSRRLLTVAEDRAYLWDVFTGQALYPPRKLIGPARRGAFSPDGRRVVVGSGDTVQIWDVAKGEVVPTVPMRHPTIIWFIAFSPDGRRVVTVGGDAARLWDAATGAPLSPLLKHHGLANYAAFTPDGRFLATTGGDTANLWDTAMIQPAVITVNQGQDIHHTAFSADGLYLATHGFGSGRPNVWDLATGQALPAVQKLDGAVDYCGFSRDGHWLLTAQADQTASVWELATGQRLFTLPRQGGRLRRVALSSDNRLAVTACDDKTVRVWELATGLPQGSILEHDDIVAHAVFSPDCRRVLTVCADWTAQVWDWTSGRRVGCVLKHGGPVLYAAFSPDGDYVLTASHDRTARVWDAATGLPLTPPLSHHGQVYGADFSPDGRYVATAASDGTARVWEAATGLPLTLPLKHQVEVLAVRFSPDGRLVLSVTRNGKVWRWDLGLTPDNRPTADLLALAQLLDGHRLDTAGGFVPVETATLQNLWQRLQARYPRGFRVAEDAPGQGTATEAP
jgi:WD40 repeat protein/serine/threonine protein kinase